MTLATYFRRLSAAAAVSSVIVVLSACASGNTASAVQQPTTVGTTTPVSTLSVSSATLPPATVGIVIPSYPVSASGGQTPYTYALQAGDSLPAGVTLSASGVIAGTPRFLGTYTFHIQVTDASASPQTATSTVNIAVAVPLAFALTSFPIGTTGSSYTYTEIATGGRAPYTFSITSGSLPAGLSLSAEGLISGVPTNPSSFFGVRVTDADGRVANSTQALPIDAKPSLDTSFFSGNAVQASGYLSSFSVIGGRPTYFYNIDSGAIPPGLTFGGSTIYGTPTQVGNFAFSVRFTDGAGRVVSTPLSINVAPPPPLTISPPNISNIVPGVPYSQNFFAFASGNTGPISFTLVSGTLPAGLTFTSAGNISGTTQAPLGNYPIVIRADDTKGYTGTRQVSLVVSDSLASPGIPTSNSGSYVMQLNGFANGSTAGSVYGSSGVGAIVLTNTGTVSGTMDTNSAQDGYVPKQSVTGSYSDSGFMVLKVGSGPQRIFAFRPSGQSTSDGIRLRMVEYDNNDLAGNSGMLGTGIAIKQSGSFSTPAITGPFVFGLQGESACQTCGAGPGHFGAIATAGSFATNGAGTVTGGLESAVDFSTAYPDVALSGTYSITDTALGRGSLTLAAGASGPSGHPVNFVFYQANANQMFIMSSDSHAGNFGLLSGQALKQSSPSVSASPSLAYSSGAIGGDGISAYPSQISSRLERWTSLSSGVRLQNQNGTVTTTSNPGSLTYDSVNSRLTDPSGMYVYLSGPSAGFGVGINRSPTVPLGLITLEAQSATYFNGFGLSIATTTSIARASGFIGLSTNAFTGIGSPLNEAESGAHVRINNAAGSLLSYDNTPTTRTYATSATDGSIYFGTQGSDSQGYVLSSSRLIFLSIDAATPILLYEYQ